MVVITSFSPPNEGIRHQQPATMAVMNQKELGKGTIFIAESQLSWVDSASGCGFSLEYPHISLHAVSRDLNSYPRECLFVMVDTNIDFSDARTNHDNEDDEDEGEDEVTELRFVPDDPSALDRMFQAMSECQTLHPDPDDSISEENPEEEDDDDDEQFDDADEGFLSQSNGNHADEMEVEGQFDDAEDAGFQEN